MADYKRPLPIPNQDTKEFWDGCKNHELRIQKCLNCSRYRFEPSFICPWCMSLNTEWVKVSGKGSVYSFVVYRQPSEPAFADMVPYVVALIELEGIGVRMISNIIDCQPEEVKIGMKVEVVFDDVTEKVTLPKFRTRREV